MIEILLHDESVPVGGEVRGEVVWTADKDCTPRKIGVSIGWRTEGRGDIDRGEVAAAHQDGGPAFAGDKLRIPFRARIPADAVPGFAGHLIRLVWCIAVRVDLPWAIDEKSEREVEVVAADGVAGAAMNGNPYLRLGLIHNPFLAEPTPGVSEALWVPRPTPDMPQPEGRRLVQVIGVKGAGKTSLILNWRRDAPGPYYYVPQTVARWRRPPLAPLVYWDELDRLPRPLRFVMLRLAAKRGATIVAATHTDLSAEALSAGLATQTVAFPSLTAADLHAFAAARIAAAAVPTGGPAFDLPPDLLTAVAAECGGSWRDAAVRLHVWTAKAARAASVAPAAPLEVTSRHPSRPSPAP